MQATVFIRMKGMDNGMKIGCVLMAAGTSSRFGENKLLYPVEGRPMLDWVLRALAPGPFARAVAVISEEAVRRLTDAAGFESVVNPRPEEGQGSSVVLGVRAMRGMDAAMFCVADQPHLSCGDVSKLLLAYRPGEICALAYGTRRGNPVIFPSMLFEELAALHPGQTGRDVIRRHEELLRLVQAGREDALVDIDTPEDIYRLRR